MKKENSLRLRHILDAIEAIENYVLGVNEEQFKLETMRHDAVIRQIEIIGEAATHLTDEVREENSDIPWKKIVGTRNRLIHGCKSDICLENRKNRTPQVKNWS